MRFKSLFLIMAVSGPGLALADMALAKSKNCFACHAVDKAVVGPSFKDVAGKYRAEKTAPDYLSQKIRKGGDGVWGSMAMPPNAQVNDAQARKLAVWILATP
jgi:cytochrome c